MYGKYIHDLMHNRKLLSVYYSKIVVVLLSLIIVYIGVQSSLVHHTLSC